MKPGENKYCLLRNLRNESDVEQFFVMPLLIDLGYGHDYVETKTTIQQMDVGKGKKRKLYVPDYLSYTLRNRKKPVLIIDAKHPHESAEEGVEDAQLYASVIRRNMSAPKPDQYCIGTNGQLFVVKHYDSNVALHVLTFDDFHDGNPKFESLKYNLGRTALSAKTIADVPAFFEFRKVNTYELPSIFEMCHKKIWKAEKRSPSSAFYEFAKLMFVKIDEDRRLHERLKAEPLEGLPLGYMPKDWVRFSAHWVNNMAKTTDNPINSILFVQLVQSLEEQIAEGKKKRIFEQGEGIGLTPSTILEVVKLMEHQDLYTVDEDLNGRLFETFLTATMRGEALGQFFTPRSVVKFMVQMARLRVTQNGLDTVLDGCCGTGGFLIEAMAAMGESIIRNVSLTSDEQLSLLHQLRTEALWGIDAGKDPPVARIARLNMLLHKDGGSRIYYADALDKHFRVESGLPLNTKMEINELFDALVTHKKKFSVVLTNPPFAMKYERKNSRELEVLQDYKLVLDEKGRQRTSLKSSVMFLERYWDLLDDHGKLLTIMDDSVLNTLTAKPYRKYLMDHFILKAVISLPKNTFVKAGGSVSTSALYLRKKIDPKEPQPVVFMGICGNVGHTDSGKERPQLNELPKILEVFGLFEDNGTIFAPESKNNFLVHDLYSGNPTLRLDAQHFNPLYFSMISALEKIALSRGWKIVQLWELLKEGKDSLTGGATPLGAIYPDEGPKFIRVNNVHPNLLTWNSEEDPCIDYHTHSTLLKRSMLRENDVILTITGTYGIAAVVPDRFGEANINQHCVRIAINNLVTPEYLAVFLNSSLCRAQMDRAVTGSSRLALDYTAIRKLRVLVPATKDEQDKIATWVKGQINQSQSLLKEVSQIENNLSDVFNKI